MMTADSMPADPAAMQGGPPPPPPAQGAPPSPEQVAQMEVENQQAQIDAILAARPRPDKAYKLDTLKVLEKALDAFSKALAGAINKVAEDAVDFQPLGWDPAQDPEGALNGQEWEGSLPGALFVPLAAIADFVSNVQSGDFKDKLRLDIPEVAADTGVKVVAGQVLRAANNKPFIDAIVASFGPPPEDTDEAPMGPPMEMGETDESVVDAMG